MSPRNSSFMSFQSTPPVKAATIRVLIKSIEYGISIHAAREGGDSHGRRQAKAAGISIHAAREGGDNIGYCHITQGGISIHAAREGGDGWSFRFYVRADISIHAAREGGDSFAIPTVSEPADFNPRRP